MYNQSAYNQNPYNQSELLSSELITDNIIFNWFGLQNDNICISTHNRDKFPDINLVTYSNPIIDWWAVLNRQYSRKLITFTGTIKSDSAEWLNNLIDLFKLKCSWIESNLDIKINDVYRRSKATVRTLDIQREHYNINFVRFSISFETQDPFFYEISSETITETDITQNSYNIWAVYEPNWVSYPKIYMIFWVVDSTDEISIQLWDRIISINETVEDWDVLIFDWVTKSVKIWWVEIDYTGPFPEMKNWLNLFEFSINGTFTVDITLLYRKNYL